MLIVQIVLEIIRLDRGSAGRWKESRLYTKLKHGTYQNTDIGQKPLDLQKRCFGVLQ
jgi:hypothetical protein